MSWDFVLSTVVIPLAIAAVVIAIQYFLAPRKGTIFVIPQNFARLKSDFADDFPKLRLSYDSVDLDKGLAWISGVIANEGPKDIHSGIVFEPLRLVLPAGLVWKELVFPDHPSKPKSSINGSSVSVLWSMLRPREKIPFSALVYSDDDKLLEEFAQNQTKLLKAQLGLRTHGRSSRLRLELNRCLIYQES